MKPFFSGAIVGALLAAPFVAQAGPLPSETVRAPDPADPHAAVPALEYRSALAGAPRAPAEPAPTPDKLWRQANDTVAGAPGHGAGHAHGAPAAPAQAAASTPAAPAPHGKHH